MRYFRTHSRLYAQVATVMLAVFLQACTHWSPVPLEPAKLPANGQVRATLQTGQRVIITSPVIEGDTIRSASTEGVRWSRPRPRPGIPLSQISTLELSKVDGSTTGVIVVSTLALGALAVFVIAKSLEDVGTIGNMWGP